MNLKLKARKLILQNYTDMKKVYEELFAIDFSQIGFIDYAKSLIAEMEVMAAQMKKFDLKGANKITGNIKVYSNVIAAIWKFCSKHLFAKFRL
jgi:hypothetical protein